MARAGSFEEAFSLASLSSKAIYFLERAAAVQREFRSAADALDTSLGFKVDRRRDLSSCMPMGQTGSPMTYMWKGKQYLVVAVSGPDYPGELIAYTLPEKPK